MSLFRLTTAWCLAMVAAAFFGVASWWPLVLVGGGAFAAGCFVGRMPVEAARIGTLTAVAALALYHYDATGPDLTPGGVAALNDGEAVELRGMVAEEPTVRETTQWIRLRVDAYRGADGLWQPTHGSVLITARLFPEYDYGDFVEMSGEITTPEHFEGFDHREYLAQQGIGSVSIFPSMRRTGTGGGSDLIRAVNRLRDSLSHGIELAMPEPEASLATGILLGDRASIPDDVTDDFNRSGISHLIAISGANMMLVAAFSTRLLWPAIGRRPAIVVSMLVIVLYAVLVGGSPSVLRATVMGVVVLGGQLSGRPGGAIVPLVLTVAVLTAWAPGLADSVSFQLSVAATAGIVLCATPLAEALGRLDARLREGVLGLLVEQVAMTFTASVAVLPIMVRSFGQISLISPVANVLAAPAFVAVIPLSLVTAIAGWLDTGLGRAIGLGTHLPLAYLVAVARFFSALPGASSHIGTYEALVIMCVLLGLGRAFLRHYEGREESEDDAPSRLKVGTVLTTSCVLVVLAGALVVQELTPRGDRLQVTVLDIGQGDAILIETPDGQVVLVDGGPSVSRLLNELGAALPSHEHRIDLVVLTHPQEDHVAGLAGLFDRFDVGGVLAAPREATIPAYHAWRAGIEAAGVPMTTAEAGIVAKLGDRMRLEVLNPPLEGVHGGADELNENSVVLRLIYGEVSFLLTGDLGFLGEEVLLGSGFDLRASVLKVGHHGSDGSTSTAFVNAVAPEVAVISAGAANSFGHPSPTTRLRLAGIPVLRTDLNGRVSFETDGKSLWIESERGQMELVPDGLAEK
ncbi:MAG: DNA internalization-related competence protein ComEC/Rec2 [Dehalococcoidia bacterium]